MRMRLKSDVITTWGDVLLLQVVEVVEGLRLGIIEGLVLRLVFHDEHAGPVQVDTPVLAGRGPLDVPFEQGHAAPVNSEDGKELIPERLCFGLFGGFARPSMRKLSGVLSDLVPGRGGLGDRPRLWGARRDTIGNR